MVTFDRLGLLSAFFISVIKAYVEPIEMAQSIGICPRDLRSEICLHHASVDGYLHLPEDGNTGSVWIVGLVFYD